MKIIAMPSRSLQFAQQVEDLRLDGDVERRRRLVGDQDVRLVGERHGDHHALALAAGELMRIGVDAAARDRGCRPAAAVRPRAPCGAAAASRPGDSTIGSAICVADAVERVERGHRLLEDHGDLGAADRVRAGACQADQLAALEDGPSRSRGRCRQQAQQRQHGLALARAGFADDGQRLAALATSRLTPLTACDRAVGRREARRRGPRRSSDGRRLTPLTAPSDRARRAGRRRGS